MSAPWTFTVERTRAGAEVWVVELLGEHGGSSRATLDELVDSVLEVANAVVVDVSRSRLLDGAILGGLAEAARRASATGKPFVVQARDASLGRVLALAVRDSVPLAYGRDEAYAAVERALVPARSRTLLELRERAVHVRHASWVQRMLALEMRMRALDTKRRTAELQRTNLLLERQDGVGYRVRSVPLGERRTALQGPGGELYDPARRVTEREREDGEPEAWVVYRRRHRLFDAGDPWSPTAVG